MTVEEYQAGRNAFDEKLARRDPNVARVARANLQKNIELDFLDRYLAEGLSVRQAEAKAMQESTNKMKLLAALHNPDMVAGGKDTIADFGDRKVNSRIGAQWRKSGRLTKLDDAAKAAAELFGGAVKMNASLVRCR